MIVLHCFPADEENPGTSTGCQLNGGEGVSSTAHILTGSCIYHTSCKNTA